MRELLAERYRMIKTLGEGGMGNVYAAEDVILQRRVAIKRLKPRYARDLRFAKRFYNEARAASAIRHQGILEIYDLVEHRESAAFIVMEYLHGEDIKSRLRRGPLSVPQIIRFGCQIANALHAAHRCGIIHRDLKPSNLFIVQDPQVPGGERIKLLDFGIAKITSSRVAASRQTEVGEVLGTMGYMAPELGHGAIHASARSDLYSVGCVLFAARCGRRLQVRENPDSALAANRERETTYVVTEPSSRNAQLDAIIVRLLARRPRDRHDSARSLEKALNELMETGPVAAFSLQSPTQTVDTAGRTVTDGVRPPGSRASRSRALLVAPAVALSVLLGAGSAWQQLGASTPSEPPSSPSHDQAPGPTSPSPAPKCGEEQLRFVPCQGNCAAPPAGVRACMLRATAGALVNYEGTNRGSAPMALYIAGPACHTEVDVQKVYHVATTVEIPAQGECEFDVELQEQIRIELRSRKGARLDVYEAASNRPLGKTPLAVYIDPDESLDVVFRRQGHVDLGETLSAAGPRKYRVTLRRAVRLQVSSAPPGAEVWRDGELVGTTPHVDIVARGKTIHRYRIQRAGYRAEELQRSARRSARAHVVLMPESVRAGISEESR